MASLGLGYPRKRPRTSIEQSGEPSADNTDTIAPDFGYSDEEEEEAAAAAAAAADQGQAPGAKNGKKNKKANANPFASVFVALIGERFNAQGVMDLEGEGRVVRIFHTFSIVNQQRPDCKEMEHSKGRPRLDPKSTAAKISCAYHIPNSRCWHGYRKFVEQSVLENKAMGFLVQDKIVIKYRMEVVVTTLGNPDKPEPIQAPPCTLHKDLAALLQSGKCPSFASTMVEA